MDKKKFLKAIRLPGSKFRADNVVVATGTEKFSGKGILQVSNGQFELSLTKIGAADAPEGKTGFVTDADFWTIQGMIEEEIEFQMHALPDHGSTSFTFDRGHKHTLKFSSDCLELIPNGFDCLTQQQQWEMQEGARLNLNPNALNAKAKETTASDKPVRVIFSALLPGFKLLDHNEGTETTTKNVFLGEGSHFERDTFHGELRDWTFGLVERDGDLQVHLTSKTELSSAGPDEDWRLFNAFLHALAFLHGQHAWPLSAEHRRDGKLMRHRIQLNNEIAATPHAPFSDTLAYWNAVGTSKWSFCEVLEKAYVFFSTESQLSRECENLLYLLREASAYSMPRRIVLLSLCSLMESLVRAIYHESIEPSMAVETHDFCAAKEEVLKELRKQNNPKLKRLIAVLSNTEPINNRMRFGAAIEHLGLMPQDKWCELYDLWSKFRNPISHRMAQSDDSDKSVHEGLLAESKIAGAINCMILKLMKYDGPVRFSKYEEKYIRI